MIHPPEKIRVLQERRQLQLIWNESYQVELPLRFLRGRCPCASCVNEFTGERIFDVQQADEDIHITNMELVGNYSWKPTWSDGHHTGLFTWDYLLQLSQEFSN